MGFANFSILTKIQKSKELVESFKYDERGATSVDYALIVALTCLAAFEIMNSVSVTTQDVFGKVRANLAAPQRDHTNDTIENSNDES